MKSKFFVLLLVFSFVFLCLPLSLFAQIIDCPASQYALPPGALRKFIEGDTNSNGTRKNPNATYKLERGKIYFWDAQSNMKFTVRIVADDDNPASPKAPPIIAPAILADNSSPACYINHTAGDLILKNIYFMHWRPDNQQAGWNTPVVSNPDNARITIQGCIFDGSMANMISVNGRKCKIFLMDNLFKNGIHPGGAFFGGGAFHGSANPHDTLVVTNNTQFCSSGYFILSHNAAHNYTLIEHNTVFVSAVNVIHEFYSANTIIRNNLFYAGMSMGADETQRVQDWFDKKGGKPGIISEDSLSAAIPKWDATLTEAKRKLEVKNNVYFWPKAITDMWKADSVYPTTWMNTRTTGMFAAKTTWPGFQESGNLEKEPGFNTDVMGQVAKFATYANKIHKGTQTNYQYIYKPGPDTNAFTVVWPLKEKFNYTETLNGTDNLPVGDLNWYPDKRKLFIISSVEPISNILPEKYSLNQNYPNPFNPTTNIRFSIPSSNNVTLKVFNALGQEIATLINQNLKAGEYETAFNADRFSSGIYFYTLKAGDYSITKKMIFMK